MDEPTSKTLREHAWKQGCTELRFNPKTMGFAWHKPDQVKGEDDRIYIRSDIPV